MQIGFVGLGNMGTTIANLAAENGHDIIGWEYDRQVVDEINTQHTNSKYLKDIRLSRRLVATDRLENALGTEMLFVAIPSLFIRNTLEPCAAALRNDTVLVNMAKGVEERTGLTTFEILAEIFPANPRVMLSGPSIANEIARRMPTVVVIAGREPMMLQRVSKVLDNDYFNTSHSTDEIGVELGGILKNIYAIGLGMFDGKEIRSINFRSVYLTLALEEMKNIGVRLGARAETFFFLAGIGDLFATSLSEHSHNRRLGELLAQGLPLGVIREQMGVLPEGCNTLQKILELAKERSIDVPVAYDLNEVINGRMETGQFINSVIKEERMYYERHSGN
jgi:glycerol-3-phosphate dehydrogenase (NAD(P)+)